MAKREQKRRNAIVVDPAPLFDLSPGLFMQFMEPLGVTEGSVEAAWNHMKDDWRDDVVKITKELAPPLMRWGGCLSSYYRWKEGVGPRHKRRPYHNLLWGGIESHQVGTHEFVDFCRRVGAEPFYCVNFESDGRKHWARPPKGGVRSAGPKEAAEWVDYCNNPKNRLRIANGAGKPFDLRLWQIGNETSYDPNGFDCETAARRTVAFAKAMRKADPELELIGWGDSGWAKRMLEVAGGHLQYIAFHHGLRSELPNSPLYGNEWRRNPRNTWRHLMLSYKRVERKIKQMRREVAGYDAKLAMTECHFGLPGRNRNEVLSTWAAGVANARALNVFQRNGDLLKIATLADFCGNRWQNNAVMVCTPGRLSYMQPVARVMSLYRHHIGKKAVRVKSAPKGLDVVAGRTGRKVFLHVINTAFDKAVKASLDIEGTKVASGTAWEIVDDPMREITQMEPDLFKPVKKNVRAGAKWTFPPASVSAIEVIVG